MIKNRLWAAWVFTLALAVWSGSLATPLWAQGENNPPEVLTSDLSLKTVLESNRVQVDFVIVDDDKVVEVTINGEPQTFEPAETVLLTKVLEFGQEASQVVVSAKDEAGNTKTVTYTVFPPGVDPDRQPVVQKEAMTWFASYDARYEMDDNPTQDLSSPVSIGGIDLQGVVPDDQQDDNRTNLLAMGGVAKGPWSAFLGAARIGYSKAKIAEQYNVAIYFAGMGYRLPKGGFDFGYVFSDINLAKSDYSLVHTVSPGYRVLSEDEDGKGTTLYSLDILRKQFADSSTPGVPKLQEDTTVFTLRWDYTEIDPQGQDTYIRKLHIGTESEGLPDSEFDYLSTDFDWKNKWDSGLLFDIGFGLAYRDFKTDEPLTTDTYLGDTRVDAPMRISTGLGWTFSELVNLMLGYQYTFNLSNKTPYERQIIGLGVNGTF